MAQSNWVGLAVTEDDLLQFGTELWDCATEGFAAPVAVKFTNTGTDDLYLHIPHFHYHPADDDQTDWTYTLLPAGESLELFSRTPGKLQGGLQSALAWVETGGAGTIVWTPTMYLNGED